MISLPATSHSRLTTRHRRFLFSSFLLLTYALVLSACSTTRVIPHSPHFSQGAFSESFNPVLESPGYQSPGTLPSPAPLVGTRKETHVASFYQDGKLKEREVVGGALYKKGELKKQESTTRQVIDSRPVIQ